jgi:hypothetical protein
MSTSPKIMVKTIQDGLAVSAKIRNAAAIVDVITPDDLLYARWESGQVGQDSDDQSRLREVVSFAQFDFSPFAPYIDDDGYEDNTRAFEKLSRLDEILCLSIDALLLEEAYYSHPQSFLDHFPDDELEVLLDSALQQRGNSLGLVGAERAAFVGDWMCRTDSPFLEALSAFFALKMKFKQDFSWGGHKAHNLHKLVAEWEAELDDK